MDIQSIQDKLLDMNKQYSEAQKKILLNNSEIEILQRRMKREEHSTERAVQEATDETGKPLFSNQSKRNAEAFKRLDESDVYQNYRRQHLEKQSAKTEAEAELVYLKFEQRAIILIGEMEISKYKQTIKENENK